MATANPITPSFPTDAGTLELKLARAQALMFAITGPCGVDVLTDMGQEAANSYLGCVADLVTESKHLAAAAAAATGAIVTPSRSAPIESATPEGNESARLLVLLAEIRAAAGDHGERTPEDLVSFISGLRAATQGA